MRRHGFEHYAAGTDFCTFTDFDIAQNLGAGTDQHASAYLRVAISVLFTCSPESNGLHDRYIILHQTRLTYDDSGRVIEHDPLADARGGVDIHTEGERYVALEEVRQSKAPLLPEPVGDSVALQGLKTFEI